MTPSPIAPPIVWAVWLGANTQARLAQQWRLSKQEAGRRLARAVNAGMIVRVGRGVYGV